VKQSLYGGHNLLPPQIETGFMHLNLGETAVSPVSPVIGCSMVSQNLDFQIFLNFLTNWMIVLTKRKAEKITKQESFWLVKKLRKIRMKQ
jgi:hypothetical protein